MLNVDLSANVWNPRIWWLINVDHPFDHHFPTTHGGFPIGFHWYTMVYSIFRQNQLQNQQAPQDPKLMMLPGGPPMNYSSYISTTYLENLTVSTCLKQIGINWLGCILLWNIMRCFWWFLSMTLISAYLSCWANSCFAVLWRLRIEVWEGLRFTLW